MAGVQAKSLDAPDEVRRPEKTTVDVVNVGSTEVGRFTFQPGWRWSDCIKPVVGTDSCQLEHVGFALSGRIQIAHEDGTTLEIGPGDAYHIDPGHDAWVVGDDAFVGIEFKSAHEFAR